MKNVLVISTSLRANSNSDILAAEVARGAAEAGHAVETVSLHGAELGFCIGCLSCQDRADGHCVLHDDADAIVQKMRAADALVFATPIYYYEMAGQMKTLLDRANPLFAVDYRFRDVYLVATAAEDDDAAFDRAVSGLEGWIECFEESRLAGVVRGGGLTGSGEASEATELLAKAYELGRGI